MDGLSPLLIIGGPTASGKSALAVDVALAFDGVVINGDSMQVYQELAILSARPAAEQMALVPHRLFGVLPAAKACSAGLWLSMARAEITAAWNEKRLPIIVGGTGLYLKALTHGLASIPAIPREVREWAQALYANLGGDAFRQKLAFLDPEAARTIKDGDAQRLMRAYEVAAATKIPLTEWVRRQDGKQTLPARFAAVFLIPERAILYQTINARFVRMMEKGALAEAARLSALGLKGSPPAMKALGVKQLLAHLHGDLPLAEAVEKAKRASRNFAKRQLTWLRHQEIGCPKEIILAQYSESIRGKIFSFIQENLLTAQS